MTYLLFILTRNVIPLCLMIAGGVTIQRVFHLDIKTMTKLLFYLFSPALVFTDIYQTRFSQLVIGQVVLFFLIFFAALITVVTLVMKWRHYQGGRAGAIRNSVLFYNSANYGIPLNQLAFHGNPLALSVQVIVMLFQNILPNTYGVYSANAHKMATRDIWRAIFRLPAVYMIPLAIILRLLHISIATPIMIPLHDLVNAFTAFALTTLGMQLGQMKWSLQFGDVLLSNALRLLVSPLLALAVVSLLRIHGLVADALILSSSVPTSLNSMLLAVEFDNEPDLASQAVFSSTLFSIITVTVVIAFLHP
ncbi:MAG: AEC family transporter [Firmicutes bacterium]|nr:AEC family transporter [Bacillota bacterium]